MLPVAEALEPHFSVYALDTPGYGLSDPPQSKPAGLDAYLPMLAEALDALGLRRVCLYGAATGAQIAVEFAKRHPERVALLVLDSAGHFDAPLIERVIGDYFPSVEPRRDGAHLMTLWNMVRDLSIFFPWCEQRASARVQRDLPPATALHALLLDYLRAGSRYDWAYRPAFYNENAARTAAVRVPTGIVRWAGSLLLPQTDALIAHPLPGNFEVLRLDASPQARLAGICAFIRARHRDEDAAAPPEPTRPRGRLASELTLSGSTVLHLRIDAQGSGRPLVLLHDAGSAAQVLEALRPDGAGARPLVLVDLPGHGESETPAEPCRDAAAYARTLTAALDALNLREFDLAGVGLGACVALETAVASAGGIRRLQLIDPPDGELEPIPLCAQSDGTHLFAGWSRVRDAALWSPAHRRTRAAIVPGEPELSPAALHRELVALMKGLGVAASALAARDGYALSERLRLGSGCGAAGEPEIVRTAPSGPRATLRELLSH